ncbi:MAG TPA: hypothetical protein VIL49_13900 [Capillimicrobium sp.]|jgi:hypothetical protein
MRATIPNSLQRLRPSPARRGAQRPQRPERAVCVPLAAEPREPEARVREAGGPEDHAHYTCSCGYVFTAQVSTSVACPHCGTGQAW